MQTFIVDIEKVKTEAIREVKSCARSLTITLHLLDEKLELIPEIHKKIVDIRDRLELIENCMKQAGFMDEKMTGGKNGNKKME